MKSFKEASEELQITKQTLTSWIEEINESHNIIWKNKTRYLDEIVINKLKQHKNIENKTTSSSGKDNIDLLEILQKENDLLVKQLSMKDEQINNLTRLIDQQQQLTISDKKEREELKYELKIALNQLEYSEKTSNYYEFGEYGKQDSSHHEYKDIQNPQTHKKSIWRYLFGK
ncbi:DUF536 domain-containing protein [Staphylococcus equorum]|uniref:DUF536 domain-containing protein n=1 Tax=Staphylococcus equorum TaxID=246432 RepID=UPI0035937027